MSATNAFDVGYEFMNEPLVRLDKIASISIHTRLHAIERGGILDDTVHRLKSTYHIPSSRLHAVRRECDATQSPGIPLYPCPHAPSLSTLTLEFTLREQVSK